MYLLVMKASPAGSPGAGNCSVEANVYGFINSHILMLFRFHSSYMVSQIAYMPVLY